MLKKLLNKNSILKITIFFSWMALWISINSFPSEIALMNQSLIRFFNGMKSINAILFSILSICLASYFFLKTYNKTKSFILIIFSFHFLSQILGLILNENRVIGFNDIYLILYAFGTISILFLIKNLNLYNLISIMMSFIILILFISILYIVLSNIEQLKLVIDNNNFYYFLNPNIEIFHQPPPRITGLSRSIAIITIFLIISFLLNKKKIYSYLYLILIYFFSILIWVSQSRGTIICFYFSSAILIFLFNNLNYYKKFLIFLLISFFSIIGTDLFFNTFKNNQLVKSISTSNHDIDNLNKFKKDKEDEKEYLKKDKGDEKEYLKKDKEDEKEYLKNDFEIRFLTQKNTSGRTDLWKNALKKFDKNSFFGYGPQADRLLLNDIINPYSNNVSNALIYSLLSGGYISVICIGLIYIYFSILFIKFLIKNKLYKQSYNLKSNNRLFITSIIFIIFFMTRSLVENSFSLFSIDFLITIISLFIFENFKFIKKNLSFN